MDIWGQGHSADLLQDSIDRAAEVDNTPWSIQHFDDFCSQIGRNLYYPANMHSLSTGHGFPGIFIHASKEQDFSPAAAGEFTGRQPGRDDPTFVDDQHISWVQIPAKLEKNRFLDSRPGTVKDKKPGVMTRLDRVLGYIGFRQGIIEIG